jgi:P4 family phage/plasmid primase-like protien
MHTTTPAPLSGPFSEPVAGPCASPNGNAVGITPLPDWALADLARSGISPEIAASAGMYGVEPNALTALVGFCVMNPEPAYAIPFMEPGTCRPMTSKTGAAYVRFRLRSPVQIGGSEAKYLSPKDAGTHLYIPPAAYEAVRRSEAIVVTEGEKKALCGCVHGIPTVGLIGVFGFQDGETHDLHADLHPFVTAGRAVIFVVDSDAGVNFDIARAAHRFSACAALRGCQLKVLVLPPEPGSNEKVGLDDLIVRHGPEYVRQLLTTAQPLSGTAEDVYLAWLKTCVSTVVAGSPDLRILADQIQHKGYFDRMTGQTRRRVRQVLDEVAPVLVPALQNEIEMRLMLEFAGVPPPEHGGVSIANNRYVTAPGCPVALKVDSIDGDIVWCFPPDSTRASRPYPRNLLEMTERPARGAENGQAGGRPRNSSPTDITNAFLAQPKFRAEGIYTLRILRGQWFQWNGVAYAKVQEQDVRGEAMAFLRQHPEYSIIATTKTLTDLLNQLRAHDACALPSDTTLPILIEPGAVKEAPGWSAMRNGAVNIENMARMINGESIPEHEVFRPPSPKLLTPYALEYEFDPDAKCPLFEQYLMDVQPDPEAREFLQMMMGLCLIPDTSYNVFFLLIGSGGEGKSVFLHVLLHVVGQPNTCHVPFGSFVEKFSVGQLTEHLVNLIGEGDTDLPHSVGLGRIEGVVKDVCDGGLLPFERKFQFPTMAPATARIVASTNSLPGFHDRSNATWDRLRIVPFQVRMRDSAKENPRLRQEIVAKELPGIFQFAVHGLAKLRKLPRFPELPEGLKLKQEHRAACDHEREFLAEHCTEAADSQLPCQDLYRTYRSWMNERAYHALGESKFAASVRRIFPRARKERVRTADGKQPHVWVGLRLQGEAP